MDSQTNWGKWLLGIIIVVIVIFIAMKANPASTPAVSTGGKTIKIGIIAPETGQAAIFGNAVVKSVALAQKDLRQTQNTYQVLVEDDGSNPGQAASAAQKLINVDHVDALITVTTGTGNAAKPLVIAAKIPNICIACTDPNIADGKYSFNYSMAPDTEAKGWLKAAQGKEIKTVAMFTQIHPGINVLADAVEKNAPEYGIRIVYKQRYEANMRDFRTQIVEAKQKTPDMFFMINFPPSVDILGQQLKDLGVKNISSESAFGLAAKPEIFNGFWFGDFPLADESLRTRFETENPTLRFSFRSGPSGYDAFTLLVKGFEQGVDMSSYISGLQSYTGVAGTAIKSKDNLVFELSPRMYVIQDGRQMLAQ